MGCWVFLEERSFKCAIRFPGPVDAPQCVGATDLSIHTCRNLDANTNLPQLNCFPIAWQITVIVFHLFLLSARQHVGTHVLSSKTRMNGSVTL